MSPIHSRAARCPTLAPTVNSMLWGYFYSESLRRILTKPNFYCLHIFSRINFFSKFLKTIWQPWLKFGGQTSGVGGRVRRSLKSCCHDLRAHDSSHRVVTAPTWSTQSPRPRRYYVVIYSKLTSVTRVPLVQPRNMHYMVIFQKFDDLLQPINRSFKWSFFIRSTLFTRASLVQPTN